MTITGDGTIPATIDAALIARAQAIYGNATGPGFRWSQESSEVAEALGELASAISFYRRIAGGDVSPEAAYTLTTSRPEAQRLPLALHLAAKDAMDEADEVVKVIAEVSEAEIAAEVRGTEGGQ